MYVVLGIRVRDVAHYATINENPAPTHVYVAVAWDKALNHTMLDLLKYVLEHTASLFATTPVETAYAFEDLFGRPVLDHENILDQWGNLPPQQFRIPIPDDALEFQGDRRIRFVGCHHMTPVILCHRP